jgi:hypothetical protein
MAEAYQAAASVPTAEDRLVRALLLGYTVLTELAPGELKRQYSSTDQLYHSVLRQYIRAVQ